MKNFLSSIKFILLIIPSIVISPERILNSFNIKKNAITICPEDVYGQEYTNHYTMSSFITTWETTSSYELIIIPTSGTGYSYDVAWGDGTISINQSGDAIHTYTNPGIYQISITGSFPRIVFGGTSNSQKIKSIDQWGFQSWISMENAFAGCTYLEVLASDNPDLSNVTSMSRMFYSCSSFNQNISSWDVSNVIDMSYLFAYTPFDQNLASWNVGNVTNMKGLFRNTYGVNYQIEDWDVSNVVNMGEMFKSAYYFNQDISEWKVGNVTNMKDMFQDAHSFNQNLNNWNTEDVINMNRMFANAITFNSPLNNWDVSNVTDMAGMFINCIDFNQNLSSWNTGNVRYMSALFYLASSFNQDIGNWDVGNVAWMSAMFSKAISFDQDIGNWDLSSNPYMDGMFSNAGLSTNNYDSTLIGWASQNPSPIGFHGGNSQYCNAVEARNKLINDHGWMIIDGGKAPQIALTNIYSNGNGTYLWHDEGNWSLGVTPTAMHAVTIPSGQKVIVANNQFEEAKCFSLDVHYDAVFEVQDDAAFCTTSPCNY